MSESRIAWRVSRELGQRPWVGVTIVLCVGLAVRVPLAFVPGYMADIVQWERLARQAYMEGLPHVYALVVQNPHIGIYPPLYHYALWFVGFVYHRFFSPEFVLETPVLSTLIKLVPILGDCAVALAVYGFVRHFSVRASTSERNWALCSLAAVLLNPAVVYNSAYWGMFGDPLYTLGIVLALWSAARGCIALAWVAITAGVLVKPQAVALVPLIIWATLLQPLWVGGAGKWKSMVWRWGQAAMAGVLTLGVVWLPFVLAGTLSQAFQALRQTVGLFAILSANAHNVWWLFTVGNGWVSDVQPLVTLPYLGELTPRTVGLIAFGLAYALALLRLGWSEGAENEQPSAASVVVGWSLWATAAYILFAFYMLATEMHENYIYPALVLLAASWPFSRRLRWFTVLLTLTALVTMILHDPPIQSSLEGPPYIALIRGTVGNSALNFVLFLVWTGLLIAHRRVKEALHVRG